MLGAWKLHHKLGTKNIGENLLADKNNPYTMGQFIWAGQDYIGEPTPYHTKNSYLGHIDTAGFPKDSYYIIKAAWTDEPMVHLFPYWDFSPGQPIDVRVYTNMPKIELFLNGTSLGVKILNGGLTADWCVSYEPGELRAVAYDIGDNAVVESARKSFGDAADAVCEIEEIGELLFVTVTASDRDGNPVENANNRVYVSVENGELLGLDNGDSTDTEQYQGIDNKCLFNGKLLAIVRPFPGKDASVSARLCKKDIPVRKIELTSTGYDIKTKLYPADATYSDLHWRLTDVGGIDSHLGKIEVSPDSLSAKVLPSADGDVYVRCGVKNGREHLAFYTHIVKNITGFGQSFLSPYDFISGGLYSHSNVTLTNGNDRGVATPRDGESFVCFSGLDFGGYGSDEVEIGLFPLSRDPFTFEIWEGAPQNGSFLLDAFYDKGSIWNTYIDVKYKLPRRLRGVTDFSLVFRQKVHIKGFRFTKLAKAFEKLPASGNDGLYGDSYRVAGDAIEDIGNNVSILFNDMDFGDLGTDRISLCWRSRCEKNSMLTLIEDKTGEHRIMLELPGSEDYIDDVYDLGRKFFGNTSIRFLFLPGCNLDLKWVRFM